MGVAREGHRSPAVVVMARILTVYGVFPHAYLFWLGGRAPRSVRCARSSHGAWGFPRS
jgi:hypothetical protein